ncbi:LacI family DNA-binding transcriptional regulator [Curtobacterium sp. 'Ferrero']|uniref:LacI family DNA-binding transcriptional regulator n=1 Tax=Curtobacterium sp. 'Ferrero' TaxID=2033654 RepID=UPI0020D0A9CF|nr:substrate-binding domain-containing protein [Curtobacterium sp. 'Ferrero']
MIDRWFYVKALGGVDAELRRAGHDLVLYNLGGPGGDRDRAFRRSMLRHRVDALVLLSLVLDETERTELELTRHPMVVIGGPAPGLRNVGVDDAEVSRLAVDHLVSLGHRRIAYMGGQDEDGMNVAVPYLRRDGFVDAMAAHGLAVPEELMVDGRFSFAGGLVAGERLLAAGDRPTAVCCASDEMALGVLLAAQRAGLSVPGDLSVIGIDGHEYGATVGLTTVAQDPEAQGRTAARIVLAEVDGTSAPAVGPAPVELVVRDTTAPPAPRA